ncbi:MAG: hypothetical protein ABJ308_13865 [Halieaceae bacterium]
MQETKYLPEELTKEGEKFARQAYSFYFRVLDFPFILICILGPWWTPGVAILLALVVLRVREDSKIMWEHQRKFWFLFAASFVVSGILFPVLIILEVPMPWAMLPFLAQVFVTTPLSRKAEVAYYNSKGYDYKGHLGVEP